jgi:hypothetical protein
LDEFREPGVIRFQTAQLMWLEREERRFHSGKECGTKDQN